MVRVGNRKTLKTVSTGRGKKWLKNANDEKIFIEGW